MSIPPSEKILYMIIRTKDNHPRATVAMASHTASHDLFRVTFSFCNPIEVFDKRTARARTMGRLNSSQWIGIVSREDLSLFNELEPEKILSMLLDRWHTSCEKPFPNSIAKILRDNGKRFYTTYKSYMEDLSGKVLVNKKSIFGKFKKS